MGVQVDRQQTGADSLSAFQQQQMDILRLILAELRVMNQVLAEGLNIQSDIESYRNDFIQPN
jgi:hypothetical protein